MTPIHPWGKLDWLISKIGARAWTGVFCSSFEPRCLAVAEWISKRNENDHFCIKIVDPQHRFTAEITKKTDDNDKVIRGLLRNKVDLTTQDLLAGPGAWNEFAQKISSTKDCSILFDITCMPKRVFLFAIKQLLKSPNVRDLVVCYTRPAGYKEGQLTEDALPPSAIPGFSRIKETSGDPITIVSVGYMAFNLGELLEQQKGRTAKFLFPFPPGSPGFRRSWRLLHDLSQGMDMQTEIKRINSMDMFATVDWLRNIQQTASGNIDLIPLGPKPHALAMGLAFPKMGESAEISYSQPRLYHPEYSQGIYKDDQGASGITAYCIRRNYIDFV